MVNVAPAQVGGMQFAAAGSLGECLSLRRDLAQFQAIGISDYRSHDAILNSYCDANVNLRIRAHAVRSPTCIHSRMLVEHACHQSKQ